MSTLRDLRISHKLGLGFGLSLTLATAATLSGLSTAERAVAAARGPNSGPAVESVVAGGRIATGGLLLLSLGTGVGAAVLLSRGIGGRLTVISRQMGLLTNNCVTGLNAALGALERGDLTATLTPTTRPVEDGSQDEVGRIGANFNEVLGITKTTIESYGRAQLSLRELVITLQANANQINHSGQGLAATARQFSASTEKIGDSMREVALASEQTATGASEVAQGSAIQARSVSESTELVKDLIAAVRNVASDATEASTAAERAGAAASEGRELVDRSVAGMLGIQATVSESAEVITRLGESSQKIGSIVETINQIAEQTNLLALNAAIEAARAGDAGRGFAVVADEVRKLAERSGSATREIGTLINDIQAQTERAVASMKTGTEEVKIQAQQTETTGHAFRRIQEVFHAVTENVQAIGERADRMSAQSDQVARSMAEVAAVVEESSAAAEQLSSSAEEVSASVQIVATATNDQSRAVHEMVASSGDLEEVARNLEATVARFHTGDADRSGSNSGSSAPFLRVAA